MAERPHHPASPALILTVVAALFCGCAREDEALQRQIVELRAAVEVKTKALEEAQAKASTKVTPPVVPGTPPPGPRSTVSEAELAQAKSRVRELEGEVATLNARLKEKPAEPPPPASTESLSMKLDVDVMKDKLEDDLTKKAAELRDLVLRQNGVSSINEISIQRVQLPPEVIAPFRSAITFTVTDNGKPLRVQFPVTADFGGRWRLPSPDKIQQACQAAREQMTSGHVPEPEPSASPPPQAPRPSAVAQTGAGGHAPKMKQVDANTFVMDWGDNKSSPSATGQPASVMRTPSPSPAASPSPNGSNPIAPPPVMPVQRDIIIKF